MSNPSNLHPGLFPSIGAVANETDDLPEQPETPPADTPAELPADDEDRPVQEIESLCMNCGQQVGVFAGTQSFGTNTTILSIGSDKTPPNFHSVLPRSHRHVLPM